MLLSTDPPVQVLPGTRVEASLGANAYELTLWSAANTSYPEIACAPADWAPSVGFALDVVAREFASLAASAPIVAEQLPLCRLGTDPPLFSLEFAEFDWNGVTNGTLESSISDSSTTDNAVVLTLPSVGKIRVNTSSAEQRAVLLRGHWFTIAGWSNYLIREAQGGRVVAAQLDGGPSNAVSSAARYDLLGVTATVEAKCDWMAAACRNGKDIKARSLYDVVLSGATNQRLASHTRGSVALDGKAYAAWVAATPDCTETPTLHGTFLLDE